MTFHKSILTCFKKYADFKGKASRTEYWGFWIFLLIVSLLMSYIDRSIFFDFTNIVGTGPMGFLFGISVLVPLIAVGARRLHDSNRSGWWQLLLLIMILPVFKPELLYLGFSGVVILAIYMLLPGKEQEN